MVLSQATCSHGGTWHDLDAAGFLLGEGRAYSGHGKVSGRHYLSFPPLLGSTQSACAQQSSITASLFRCV